MGPPFEPLDGKVLEVTVNRGKREALNSHIKLRRGNAEEQEEAFIRYYIRLGENWNPTRDGGKLPGFSGTYGRAGWGGRRVDGFNGWSARGAFFQQGDAASSISNLRAIGSYVYHAGMREKYGEKWGWNLGETGVLAKNRWYCVEQQVRLNTVDQNDGVLRAWIDGKLVFEKLDIRFRSTDSLKIESAWMNVYHGGTASAPHDMTLYIDNLVIASRYIGPALWRSR
jgi:hypothetical protein